MPMCFVGHLQLVVFSVINSQYRRFFRVVSRKNFACHWWGEHRSEITAVVFAQEVPIPL